MLDTEQRVRKLARNRAAVDLPPLHAHTLTPSQMRTVREHVARNTPVLAAFVQGLLNELEANRQAMEHLNLMLRQCGHDDPPW